jgi:hypothetical protein
VVVSSLVDTGVVGACVEGAEVGAVVDGTNVDGASVGATVVGSVVEGHEAHWGHCCVLRFLTSKTPHGHGSQVA